jgi:hypothetical protein
MIILGFAVYLHLVQIKNIPLILQGDYAVYFIGFLVFEVGGPVGDLGNVLLRQHHVVQGVVWVKFL